LDGSIRSIPPKAARFAAASPEKDGWAAPAEVVVWELADFTKMLGGIRLVIVVRGAGQA
jgi:hypothetical protein